MWLSIGQTLQQFLSSWQYKDVGVMCRGTKEPEFILISYICRQKYWQQRTKCHKQAQSHTISKIQGIFTNPELPGPDANLWNSVFVLKTSVFNLFFSYRNVAKTLKCLEKTCFSFITLTLYHQTTSSVSALTLPVKPLWTPQPVWVHD